jgi:HD-GYP domain-containing protein (c-di-GMP phosphodiesterase class II)
VYRKGKPYQAAADELDVWAGKQFDPVVVAAFHRVPQEDWQELHQQSLMKREDELDVRRMVESLLESHLEVVAH